MRRLETQINQIYLHEPQSKTSSLVVHEESLGSASHVFLVGQVAGLRKKTETTELQKISEIVLEAFRAHKKMSGEALFESVLAQINQNLADLAHEGRKAWVGKLSFLIALKSGNSIFLANHGPASAWMRRKSDLAEILGSEKTGDHPLKTFTNFSQGKLAANDCLILTTASIFNFISADQFAKILTENPVSEAVREITSILQDSVNPGTGFGALILELSRQAEIPAAAPVYTPEPEVAPTTNQPRLKWRLPKLNLPAASSFSWPSISLPSLSLSKRLSWRWPNIRFAFFNNLSPAGKFLFISFVGFLLLFVINLSVYGLRLHNQKTQEQITALTESLAQHMADAQSALIYKNDQEALDLYDLAAEELEILSALDREKAAGYESELSGLRLIVNKISTIENPAVHAELNYQPTMIAAERANFLLSNADSNSVYWYDTQPRNYFLLNSLNSPITGIASWAPAGVTLSTATGIHSINQNLNLYESEVAVENGDIAAIETYTGNLYALNRNSDQIIRISSNRTVQTAASVELDQARDFGVDGDFYILFADRVTKVSRGNAVNFPLPPMSEEVTNADRIYVGSNIYILEANKKRIIIMDKSGRLINQVVFPSLNNLTDFVVDEAGRNLYLLDYNRLLKITF